MQRAAWNRFVKARDHYRFALEELRCGLPKLGSAQQELVNRRSGGKAAGASGQVYTVETPIVYNGALDDVSAGSEIRLILVADNPGRREQAAVNRRYLVGPSGKIAEGFFRGNPSLGIDFRENTVILNKTPIHTPRTADLRELCRLGGPGLVKALAESQRTMARLLLEFHQALAPVPVWITGYSEMRPDGIFAAYTETLGELYRAPAGRQAAAGITGRSPLWEWLFVYRHFSMNQFTIDLRRQAAPGESLETSLARIGTAYRRRILGW
ncbi:MAG: hypothetical protein LBK62_13925 [Treponema sp.]|jgi:hypothetical protein|nr:hypothetical protein [Treponema sp.]